MKNHPLNFAPMLSAVALVLAGAATPSLAVDVEAAKALAKKSECLKCHATDKDKKGPSLKKIAEKYKGKADGEEKVIKNLTTTPKVKLSDGTEEEHKALPTKDPAVLKNMAEWILSH